MKFKSLVAGSLAGAITAGAVVYSEKQLLYDEPHTHTVLVTIIDEGRSGALAFAQTVTHSSLQVL
jgi:hypothetical protein